MKRLLLALAVLALGVAAVPLAASANHSNGNGPKFEKANGTGESPGYGQVHVNAKDKAGLVDGHFFIDRPPMPKVQGDVTCLTVNGNMATIGGFDRANPTTRYLIEVTDNGEPGQGADRHRWRMATPMENTSGPDCPAFGMPPPETIVQGNYIVHGGGGGDGGGGF
jgi:hypothetical protein